MRSFAFRGFPFLLVLLLAGCQYNPFARQPSLDERFQQLGLSLSEQNLDEAHSQFVALQSSASGDTRLTHYQRQLADAYMAQGQVALQRGDLDRAAQALGKARSLLPQAPALSHDLNQTIDQMHAPRHGASE